MLRINGEITTLINDIDFESKEVFLEKLRALRKTPNLAQNCSYAQFYDMVGIAIQQAFYINEKQLMRFKNYCIYRTKTGAKDGNKTN